MIAINETLSIKTIRRNCLECSGDSLKAVLWCTRDGLHSTPCEFWPFRHGVKPATFRAKYGDRLVTSEKMPPAEIHLDELPANLTEAATAEINIEGYHQPAVTVAPYKPKRAMPPEQRQAARERMLKMHAQRKDGQDTASAGSACTN